MSPVDSQDQDPFGDRRLGTPAFDRELTFASQVAEEAGELLLSAYGRVAAREKGPSDLVTEADLASQRHIAARIAETFPDHTLLAEEEGIIPEPGRSWKWIVDPLDGTINFAHGFPFWCVSIGLEFEGRMVVGVVHDPLGRATFAGRRGGEPRRNGEPVRVSEAPTLRRSLIGAGLPTRFGADADRQMAYFRSLSTETHSIRRTGSTALNLAILASGGLDLYYTTSVHPWDVAAGILLVEAAGGRVTDLDGGPYRLDQPTLLASNGKIHGEAVERLRAAWPV